VNNKTILVLVGLAAAAWMEAAGPAVAAPDAVNGREVVIVDIGSRRELFVDHYLIDKLNNSELRLHRPRRAEVAIRFDKPWEGLRSAYPTVIKDGDVYRMYYRGLPSSSGDRKAVTCYAESTDGIIWVKPALGLFEVEGTTKNNVILSGKAYNPSDPNGLPFHNFVPFLDTRPGVPKEERYKALAGRGKDWMGPGLCAYVSGDGIRWALKKESVITNGRFDSQNVAFWSESEGCYVCYFRTLKYLAPPGKDGKRPYRRWVSRTRSPDFINWSEPVEMTAGDAALEHLYVNQTQPYFRAPHIYVALAARFVGCRALSEVEKEKVTVHFKHITKASTEGVLLTGRGGNRYDRTFMEGFIRPGPDYREWTYGSSFPAYGIVQTSPTEMSIYAMQHSGLDSLHLERLTMRLDGFASVHAPYEGGEMVTKPFKFEGKTLELNFATSTVGFIRVEIQDQGGRPLHGYHEAACPMIVGNRVQHTVRWNQETDVHSLSGRPIRLRFVMKDADLYSIRFQ